MTQKDREIVEILKQISVTSARLARNIEILAIKNEKEAKISKSK